MAKALRQQQVLSVFIGSPGDLQEERRIARDVVNRINRSIARNLSVHVELRGWEDTLPGQGRPQAIINEDLRECDMFVGLVWKRWGTPPSDDGDFESGFEEEYHLALELQKDGEMQEVMLFFKEMPDAVKQDPGDQASKVIAFKEKVMTERHGLFESFGTPENWKERFYDILAEYLTKHFTPGTYEPDKGEPTKPGVTEEGEVVEVQTSLDAVVATLNDEEAHPTDLQVARANLYTLALLHDQIDRERLIATQDLHYLYSHRERIKLERPESWLIFRTLLADRDGIKTGWYWIRPEESKVADILSHIATRGIVAEARLQALRLLRHVSEEFYRRDAHKLTEDADPHVAEWAFRQLAVHAGEEDLELLRQLATEEEGELAEVAWKGVLHALAHTDPNAGVDWILNTPPERRSYIGNTLDVILQGADDASKKKLLASDNSAVRLAAMEATRTDLTEEELRAFTRNSDRDIAAVAFLELLARGHDIDEAEIDRVLDVKPAQDVPSTSFTLASFLGNWPVGPFFNYSHDDILFELYKARDAKDLSAGIDWKDVKSPIRYEALIDQHYDDMVETLREDISSGFSRIQDQYYEQLEQLAGREYSIRLRQSDEYEDFTRGRFYRAAFSVLSSHATPEDLDLARAFIRDPHVSLYQHETLKYAFDIVARFGTGEDAPLVKHYMSSVEYDELDRAALTLLRIDPEHRQEHALELLHQDERRVRKVALQYSLYEDEVLHTESVREQLYDSDEGTRLTALAYLGQKMTNEQLVELLEEYPRAKGFDFYYYDVICWLDRLLYAPASIAESYRDTLLERLEKPPGLNNEGEGLAEPAN